MKRVQWWRWMDLGALKFASLGTVLSVSGLTLALSVPMPAELHLGSVAAEQRLAGPAVAAPHPLPLELMPTQAMDLPIAYYHYTPPDFEAQLQYLQVHGFSVVSLDEALAGLEGRTVLPAKPIVLTFDDGFANQMEAFALLQKYRMPATFYIINAGVRSKWCVGSGRRYNDPLQPPEGCGDAYLSWDQVRTLDKSGLITIGGHTLDHFNLAELSEADQRTEIADSKTGIEREIGHAIKHFAYPYGGYTQASIDIARQAGYVSAVTTIIDTHQPEGARYTLRRVHDIYALP
jgi:peptidoglycan/xylan/chitin deacetylase (PgdA/CDA1 family)